jgi:hypothetical protein
VERKQRDIRVRGPNFYWILVCSVRLGAYQKTFMDKAVL